MSTAIVSFYMNNIPAEMVRLQRSVISKFLPHDFTFLQILTSLDHAESLDNFMNSTAYDQIIFLDIDCIPLTSVSLIFLASEAEQSKLIGCAQRASHIENEGHIYVGPFCCAFSRELWNDIGRPSFSTTPRGDVGEELTYACQENGKPFELLWPSSVEEPKWPLAGNYHFGLGTEYDNLFWHSFESRSRVTQDRFMERCREVIEKSF